MKSNGKLYVAYGSNLNLEQMRHRCHTAEVVGKTKAEKMAANLCKNCHKPLSVGVRSDAVFCSDACRIDWRRRNRKVVQK